MHPRPAGPLVRPAPAARQFADRRRPRVYGPEQLADKSWLSTAPEEKPFRDGLITPGPVHHFLLPAEGWGAVAGEKEARELAPVEAEKLKWRTALKRVPRRSRANRRR